MARGNSNWVLWETIGDYDIWCREKDHQTIWTATSHGYPPSIRSGGYPNREYLLKVKGIA